MRKSMSWGSWAACGAVLSQLACREVPWPPDGEGGAGGETGDGAAGTAGEGGSAGAPKIEPVLGCDAEAWPAYASLELLPHPEFADSLGLETVRAISADGAVLVGDYRITEFDVFDDIAGRRPIVFRSSAWELVDEAARGIATVVNCDGSTIAGRLDDQRAFIKTSGSSLVTITPEGPYWSAEPEDSSADGNRIVGNLRYSDVTLNRGATNPVVWSASGEPTFWKEWTDLGPPYIDTTEPRSLFHVRFDGLSFAGGSNICWSGQSCPGPDNLFVSTGPGNETMYEGAPWSVASADLTTFSGWLYNPIFTNDLRVVNVFRPPAQNDAIACLDGSCWAVALSSRGNVLLVNFVTSTEGSAHIWTAQHGFRSLAALLGLDGINVPLNMRLTAVDMSDDGRVITGNAFLPNSNGGVERNVFRAYLPLRTYE
jgi:hypothetical protein